MPSPAPNSAPDLSKLRIDRSVASLRRRRRRKWLWLVALAIVVVAGALWQWLRPHPLAVHAVPVVTAYPSQQYVVLNATGYVVAQRKAAISSKATGTLEWLGVAEGSRVKEGDVIARIDDRDVLAQAQSAKAAVGVARANIEQNRAELQNSRVELARDRELVTKGFISRSALDAAQARYDRAVAAVASTDASLRVALANARNAELSVDYTKIRAPFDGVVLTRNANVGDLLTPFSNAAESKGAVVTMADMSTLEVEADVSESSLDKVKVGQPAEIVLDAIPDARFLGRIDRMVPTVDRAKATVTAKVKFDAIDPRILPEMSAKVGFLSREVTAADEKATLAVNRDAVAQRDGRSVLYVIRNDRAVAVPVTTGASLGDLVAITGDVKSGDKAVAKPEAKLASGALVAVTVK
ncbi:MAG TPA: efflux RND transporter periplasmic adaptor subunit [Casimicrobiaceae bacterium]